MSKITAKYWCRLAYLIGVEVSRKKVLQHEQHSAAN